MNTPQTELLARFILSKRQIRASDGTVKADAFIPYPHKGLSVTRHEGLSQSQLWQIGQNIAQARPATLQGRADISSAPVRAQLLNVIPDDPPDPNNPNHANITGWPAEKPAQKIIAQELASHASYLQKP